MSADTLTQEAALRIGLAARVLPDTDAARLMKVLVAALGLPLTEQKLGQVTARQLQSGADGEFGNMPLPAIKSALDYLWGKAGVEVDDDLPAVQPYRDGDMPGSIRVAIASNGGDRLDGHFGSCARFLVYQVAPQEVRLIDVRTARKPGADDDLDKNEVRSDQIADCDLLYVVSIGGPAAAKVVKADVHPIKVPNGADAVDLLRDTQQVLAGSPPPWLAKVMGHDAEQRIRFERSEEDEA